MKRIALALALSFLSVGAFAQQVRNNYYSTLWWNELNVKGKFNDKFFYQFDFQYRTASDATNKVNGNRNNPFENMMQMQIRPFFGYHLAENVKFSLAPSISPTWNNWRSNSPAFSMEYRATAQLQFDQKYGRFAVTFRNRLEYRLGGSNVTSKNSAGDMFNGDAWDYQVSRERYRFRYMLRAIFPFKGQTIEEGSLYMNIFDEVGVAFGSNVPSNQGLDQNRISICVGYRTVKDIRLELGYINQIQFFDASTATSSVTNVFHNNGVHFFLIFNNMNTFFKKEKPKPAAQ